MEELEKKVAELEEKLDKARTMYKEQKAELDKANAELMTLKNSGGSNVEALQRRIKELEDEIIINGSSSEEIKSLNTRLDKAKEVFAAQKEEINKLTKENADITAKAIELSNAAADLTTKLNALTDELEKKNQILNNIKQLVA